MITTRHTIWAIWFALAFLSDSLDGWCYRKFASDRPYQHWFNRLPITLDPIADLFLGICGLLHIMGSSVPWAQFTIALLSINFILNWLGKNGSKLLSTVALTTLTYYWFAVMVIVVGGVWRWNCTEHWLVGFIATMVIFYAIWLNTRVKGRTIRKRG